jgi:SNF2 family DNA or RNA helicase
LRLRQACADPRLLDPECAADDSAKLRALRELLDEAVDGGHRALVFSQFVSVLDLIEPALVEAGLPCLRLDGSTPPRDRLELCDRFNGDPTLPVLLISLKAGGTGLNLTGADTVIHFDPWWNPAVEAQATDRAHRIGQTRTVTSYKLIAAGTVEERVLALQQSKAGMLAEFFAESGEATARVSLAEIQRLLED